MSVHIPLGHFSPDPCQQICVLLGGETAVRACGSAGTHHASINTSDVNKQCGEYLHQCVHNYTCMCIQYIRVFFEGVLGSDCVITQYSTSDVCNKIMCFSLTDETRYSAFREQEEKQKMKKTKFKMKEQCFKLCFI